MEINGVAHVMLTVNRFGECRDFYDQVMPKLGLETVYHSDVFAYYVGGRTAFGIRPVDPAYEDDHHIDARPGLHHLCFRARSREDVDELHPFLQEIGADIVRAPEEGPWAPGYYSLSFRDPCGIRLEVNYVPGKGIFHDGAEFNPAPDHPLEGRGPSAGAD